MTTEAFVDEKILQELLNSGYDGEVLSDPMRTTQGCAMTWIRDKYKWNICPEYRIFDEGNRLHGKFYGKWCCEIKSVLPPSEWQWGVEHGSIDSDKFYYMGYKACCDTFEEAVDECIRYTLNELINKKKEE